jgi:acetate---CoA ligase (ADP-forming)
MSIDISRLLRPRSIVVVGVSERPGSPGANILGSLANYDYAGTTDLVSRGRTEVLGRPCYPTIEEMPEGLDLAVLCLPRAGTVEALAACARRKVGAAIVFASGFAEQDAVGRAEQDELARIALMHDIALLGPNCLGIQNPSDGISLGLGLAPRLTGELAKAKPMVAIVSQSGGMGVALGSALRLRGFAATYIVSTGNEAALGLEEVIADAIDEPEVKIIALLAEQFRKPQRFLELARRARGVGKPIVLMHPGASAKAREAAASHTGALAGNHATMRALVQHEAVLLVESFDEWVDVATLLCHYPTPPKGGLGVVTNSGAFRGIAFDLCDELGLALPTLAPATQMALRRVLPPFAHPINPLDVTAQTAFQQDIVGLGVKPLIDDPAIASLVVAMVGAAGPMPLENARHAIAPIRAAGKPAIYAIFAAGSTLPPELEPMLRAANIPFQRSPEAAVRAMARATAYGQALSTADRRVRHAPHAPPLPARGLLTEYRGKEWLAAAGIPIPGGALAADLAEAQRVAARIGYPIVLKAQAASLSHKSEAQGIVLNIGDDAALAAGWKRLHANLARTAPDLALDGVLVERMAGHGIEMAVGARRDQQWGPALMVALGGIWIETLNDVRVMPADLDEVGIVAEIGKLRGAKLLQGARGAEPADIPALAQAVARIGALIRATPAVQEIDVNPLLVYGAGRGVLALDALIVTA